MNNSKTLKEIADDMEVNMTNEALDEAYDNVINAIVEAKEQHLPIDEGLIKAVIGGAGAMVFGPQIMAAVCKVLGIDTKGSLGSLMTSRLILTACAAQLGWKA